MRNPPPGVLRVLTGNVYYKNPDPRRAVRIACQTRAHSIGLAEGSNLPRWLRVVGRLRGYVPLIPTATQYQYPVDALDCPMLVRRNLRLRHESHTQVSDRLVPHVGIAPERTWTLVVYELPGIGRVAHLAIHPNWVDGIATAAGGVARQYVKSMRLLDALITLAEALADVVVVTGDVNSRETSAKPFTTAYDVFAEHNLTVHSDGLDAIAHSRRLVLDRPIVTIPESRTKSDHPWLVADLRLKR